MTENIDKDQLNELIEILSRENNTLRIGPPAVDKERFKMPGKNGKLRKGKRFEIPQYLTEMGLFAYEFSAGRLTKFSDNKDYQLFRKNVLKYDLFVSLHAPYYISLTAQSAETYEKSIERVGNTLRWATILGASCIVVHPGTYANKRSFSELKDQIVNGFIKGRIYAEEKFPEFSKIFKKIKFCPETMGKKGQLGTVDEIIDLCDSIGLDNARPCIDFGHIYARDAGKTNMEKLYIKTLSTIEDRLGKNYLKELHIHFSHISYTNKGEQAHVPNTSNEWGPDSKKLFRFIKEYNMTPIIINESPILEEDALILLKEWNEINK